MSERQGQGGAGIVEFLPRPIRPEDVPQVHALIGACYREYGLTMNLDDDCEKHIREPVGYFRAHGGEYWVVPVDGRVMATVAMTVDLGPVPPVAELKSMYVDRSLRRRGLGRRLVNLVLDAARAAGCGEVELWSDTRFEAAHAMYESVGFVRCGRRVLQDSNTSAEYGYRRAL